VKRITVNIQGGPSNNLVGRTSSSARNVISANAYPGVWINGSGASSNQIQGSYIGTNATTTVRLGNGLGGVHIDRGASSNPIGGASANDSNLLEYKAGYGVGIGAGSVGDVIQFDIINLDGGNGVLLAGCSGNSVVDCTIEATEAWGIFDSGSGNYYAYNTFANNGDGDIGDREHVSGNRSSSTLAEGAVRGRPWDRRPPRAHPGAVASQGQLEIKNFLLDRRVVWRTAPGRAVITATCWESARMAKALARVGSANPCAVRPARRGVLVEARSGNLPARLLRVGRLLSRSTPRLDSCKSELPFPDSRFSFLTSL
jgi:hypothetical protein